MIWNESEFELVNVDSQTALATPQDRYFDSGGIAAYSCLIPVSHAVAKSHKECVRALASI